MQKLRPNASKWDAEKHFPLDVFKEAGQLGFGGLYVSPDNGGSGFSRLDSAVIIEALAYGCPSTAAFISIHNMCCGMINKYGSDELRGQVLPSLVSMETVASYCLTEPANGSDAANLRTTAKLDPSDPTHYIINGAKAFISGAGSSGYYVVMCRTGAPDSGARGVSAIVVPADAAGLSFGGNESKMGWSCQPTRMVLFDNVRVPVTNRLGPEGRGFAIAMEGLDGGRINIAACSVGAASSAVSLAQQYVGEREQFGTKIAAFQNTQFKLADAAAEVFTSRLAVRAAATALDSGDAIKTPLCAAAKLVATERCFTVVDNMLQLFGGYGYLQDYQVERMLRDLRVHRILEGTNEIMRMILYREMSKDVQ